MTAQLDLFAPPVRASEYWVVGKSRGGHDVCCWVRAEHMLPYHDTIVTDAAPVLRHAIGLNWGRFLRTCKVTEWREI